MPILANAKHELFAQELAKGVAACTAYVNAGFKANDGNAIRLKGNERVQARVAEILSEAVERFVVDEAYVIETIRDTVERCRQAEPVRDRRGELVLTETPNGSLAPAYTFNAPSVLKGAELLGKHIGMFKDRLEVTGKNGAPIETIDRTSRDIAKDIAFTLAKGAKEQSVTH